MIPLLEVEGLEVVYGHAIRAIQGVSFAVEEGRIVGLLGLNGAGKTTTIRAISGFLPTENVHITDGRLRFAGNSIRGMRPFATAWLGITVVPERDKVFDTLTVRENLAVALIGGAIRHRRGGALPPIPLHRRHPHAVSRAGAPHRP